MPIKSYLAFPRIGKQKEFEQEIHHMTSCELLSSDDGTAFVLVTDTDNECAEEKLIKNLESLDSLQGLSLVSAWSDQAIAKVSPTGSPKN